MNKIGSLKLSSRIKTASELFIILFCCVTMVLTVHFHTQSLKDKLNTLNRISQPKVNVASGMHTFLNSYSSQVLEYISNQDIKQLEKLKESADSFEYFLKRYHDLTNSPERNQLYLEVNINYDFYNTVTSELINIENDKSKKIDNLIQSFNDIDSSIADKIRIGFELDNSGSQEKLNVIQGVEVTVNRISYHLFRFIETDNKQSLELVFQNSDILRNHLTRYMEQSMLLNEEVWIRQVEQLVKQQDSLIADILFLHTLKRNHLELFIQIRQVLDHIINVKIGNEAQLSLNDARREIDDAHNMSNVLFLLISIFSLLLGAVMVVIFHHHFNNRIYVAKRDRPEASFEVFHRNPAAG